MNSKLKTLVIKTFVFFSIFLIAFLPRVIGSGSDMANFDSQHWHPRSTKFVDAVLDQDWERTYQQYHPGTVMMWMSGFSKYTFEELFKIKYGFSPRNIPHHFDRVNFAAIFPLVFIISLLITLSFYELRKFKGLKFALIFLLLITFEPFFLGVSRFLHLTALSTMFGFLAFLYYVDYIRSKSYKFLVLCGILIGLGISTKVSLLIMLPVFGIILLYSYIIDNYKHLLNMRLISKKLIDYLLLIAIVVAVFFVVNPFMWVSPIEYITKIINEGIIGTAFLEKKPQPFMYKYSYYIQFGLFRLAPITFITFLLGFALYLKNIRKYSKSILTYGAIYYVIYYLFLSIPSKLKDRYLVEMIPVMLMFSTFFIYYIYKHYKQVFLFISVLFVLFTALTLYRYYPAYSYYHSDLVLGPSGLRNLGVSPFVRGEYYANVAHYLNKKDDKPEEKNVLVPDSTLKETFAPFYRGKTFTEVGNMKDDAKVNYAIGKEDSKGKLFERCELIKTFGPKNPLGDDVLFLFDCSKTPKEVLDVF